MNEKLKQQLTEWEASKECIRQVINPIEVPYIIYYLTTRFSLAYKKNKEHFNAILDTEKLRLVPLEQYGEYLKEICLNTKFSKRYSNSYSNYVDELCDNVNKYLTSGVLISVNVDDYILDNFDDLEYKEEFVELLANSSSRSATYNDYEELKDNIEDEIEFRYRLEKED